MWHPPQGTTIPAAPTTRKSADWAATAVPAGVNSATGDGEAAEVLRDGPRQGHGRASGRSTCRRREIALCSWLTDEELKVYASEYGRNGFQGGLQSYRVGRVPRLAAETQLFAGRTIDVPSLFLSGKSDWGVYQRAGSLDNMKRSCTKFEGVELIDGAGHWVQQEKSAQVADRLIKFVQR